HRECWGDPLVHRDSPCDNRRRLHAPRGRSALGALKHKVFCIWVGGGDLCLHHAASFGNSPRASASLFSAASTSLAFQRSSRGPIFTGSGSVPSFTRRYTVVRLTGRLPPSLARTAFMSIRSDIRCSPYIWISQYIMEYHGVHVGGWGRLPHQ